MWISCLWDMMVLYWWDIHAVVLRLPLTRVSSHALWHWQGMCLTPRAHWQEVSFSVGINMYISVKWVWGGWVKGQVWGKWIEGQVWGVWVEEGQVWGGWVGGEGQVWDGKGRAGGVSLCGMEAMYHMLMYNAYMECYRLLSIFKVMCQSQLWVLSITGQHVGMNGIFLVRC